MHLQSTFAFKSFYSDMSCFTTKGIKASTIHSEEEHSFWGQAHTPWVQILVMLLNTSCKALIKLLNILCLGFPKYEMGIIIILPWRLWKVLNVLIWVKHLQQYLENSEVEKILSYYEHKYLFLQYFISQDTDSAG